MDRLRIKCYRSKTAIARFFIAIDRSSNYIYIYRWLLNRDIYEEVQLISLYPTLHPLPDNRQIFRGPHTGQGSQDQTTICNDIINDRVFILRRRYCWYGHTTQMKWTSNWHVLLLVVDKYLTRALCGGCSVSFCGQVMEVEIQLL